MDNIQFTVGNTTKYTPQNGDNQYYNPEIKDDNYTVSGPSGFLIQGAHINKLKYSGFVYLNGTLFNTGESYTILF